MEKFDGSLLDELREHGHMYNEVAKISMCSQITSGVMYMHDQGVIHADIGIRYQHS